MIVPIITIEFLEGRTRTQKEQLAKEITDVVEKVLGVPRDFVEILFCDVPRGNYAKGGRILD